tara:strand:- start:4 stop:786 length:783 start_codon:yes stop_codon:yes gene_type:complete
MNIRSNYTKKGEKKGFIRIHGYHAVIAALQNPKRKHQKLIISSSNGGIINQKIRNSVNEIVELSNREMSKVLGGENIHQGIILTTSNIKQPTLEEILSSSLKNKASIVIMLDQVTDPNNIGSIMRSCAMFNCNTIIVSKNNAPDITPSMAKAASGSLEVINYIKVTNLVRTIENFKKNNFWVYGMEKNKKNSNNKFKISKKSLIILGSENKGLRDLTSKACDELISIPTTSKDSFFIDSLNVSNACSIVLYEHYKNNILI